MKKLFAVMVCIMILTCSACAKNAAKETLPETTSAPQTEAVSETTREVPEETVAVTEAPAENAAEKAEASDGSEYKENPAVLHPLIVKHSEGGQNPDNTPVFTLSYPSVELTEEEASKYPALDTALREDLNSSFSQSVQADRTAFTSIPAEERTADGFNGYYSHTEAAVTRADENFLSVRTHQTYYAGGAHPDSVFSGYTYRTSDGSVVAPSDIFTDRDSLIRVLTDKLKAFKDVDYFNLEESLQSYEFETSYMADKIAFNMVLTDDAVVFYFNNYELAPYASGMQVVVLPYAEYAPIMKAGIDRIPESYAYPFDTETDLRTAGGSFRLETEYSEYDIIKSLNFVIDGKTTSFETFTYSVHPYIVHRDGRTLIDIFQTRDDDENFYQQYELKDGEIVRLEEKNSNIPSEYKRNDGSKVGDINCYSSSITTPAFTDPAVAP